MILFNIGLIFFCFINIINSCGITTHTEIAHRAASHYEHFLDNSISINQLIKKYQSAFQAGNPYPDSFFPTICKKGVFHYVSEDTHWVPFINATINYINKTYSKPYNENALRLIVFLLGFTSHQIADVNWHSLGLDQGFLSAMGFVNFHGSFDNAHQVGDVGSDIVNQFELNTKYIADIGDWFIPYNDLYNIYVDYYGKEIVTIADIIECSSLLFLGRLGEQLAISLLYTDYSRKSPFITNKLNDYFLGGMDDMATWTQISWNKVLHMLEYGLDQCYLDHNIIYVTCNNVTEIKFKENKLINSKSVHNSIREEYILDKSYAKFTYSDNGVYFQPSEKFKFEYDKNINSIQSTKLNEFKTNSAIYANSSYFILNDYATLGWSLASGDLNNDNSDDLVVGAPVYSEINAYQNGLVFIINSKNGYLPMENLNLDLNADQIIYPPDNNKNNTRFGHSIIILDINQDGYNDIVVSAPSYNLGEIKYQGQVYIYFGNSNNNYKTPSVVITCDNIQYCNLGSLISKGDVDGDKIDDLIIGAPYAATCGSQCGLVGVLLSKQKQYPSVITVKNLDWIIEGNMIYEWFGVSAKAKFGYLAVGASQSRLCALSNCSMSNDDVQAIGRVYLYQYPSNEPVKVFKGEEEFEQFGYDLDLSLQFDKKSEVIAISSYTKNTKLDREGGIELNEGGIVQVYDITDLQNAVLITTLKSDRAYSGFGSVVKFADLFGSGSEDLIVGAQLRSDNLAPVLQIEEGAVYVFNGGSQFPNGNITDDCPLYDVTPCPSQKAKLVFSNKESQSRFGHSLAVIKNTSGKVQIAISAARSDNEDSRLSGKVKLFSLY